MSANKPVESKNGANIKKAPGIKARARATRSERIDLRINAETKALLTHAFELAGYSSLTSFVIATAKERAQRVIEEHNQFSLSNRDRDIFMDALANPPAPNRALRNAARKYGTK